MAESSEEKRKEMFRLLGEAQDKGDAVEDSRTRVAAQFHTNVVEVRGIEREGIAKQWAPL